MSSKDIEVVSEEVARKLITEHQNLVVVHTKKGCPVCEYFIPEVVTPILKEYNYVKSVVVTEQMAFPHEAHPVIFFFKGGKCVQHPIGAAPPEAVKQLMETFYGKPI
jgi:hypothetical protein